MHTSRRDILATGGAALLAALLGTPAWAQATAEGRNENAFNARSPASVYAALGLGAPVESPAVVLTVPDIAENGASVPVEVEVKLPDVTRILIVGEKNLFPLLADARVTPRAVPWVEAKVKLAETSNVRAIVEAGGRLYTASRRVRVIVGGCLPG